MHHHYPNKQFVIGHNKDIKMRSFRQFLLNEGINDPGIFKAVFMAGGPGSGKSFIAGKTGLTSMGLVLINSDDVFEAHLAKAGMKTTPKDIYSEKGQTLRLGAKALTGKKQDLAIDGRLGLLIDGTGKDVSKIKKQKAALELLGYDTMMIFVNTTEDTSLERNRGRARTLPDKEVSKMWSHVQENIGAFQRLFKGRIVIVDNSKGKDAAKETMSAYKTAVAWIKKGPSRRSASTWIAIEKKRRGIKA
jgi:dephospho-CoA kinase